MRAYLATLASNLISLSVHFSVTRILLTFILIFVHCTEPQAVTDLELVHMLYFCIPGVHLE